MSSKNKMIKYTVIDTEAKIVDTQIHEDSEAAQEVIWNASDNSHCVIVSPSVDKMLFVERLLHSLNWVQHWWGYEAQEGCNTYSISHNNGKFFYRGKPYKSFDSACRAVHKRRLHNLGKMIKLI